MIFISSKESNNFNLLVSHNPRPSRAGFFKNLYERSLKVSKNVHLFNDSAIVELGISITGRMLDRLQDPFLSDQRGRAMKKNIEEIR